MCRLSGVLSCPFMQEVPDGRKESPGGPWHFAGLMPLFDPPRHDSAETIRRALNLGVNVKMITGNSFIPFQKKVIVSLEQYSINLYLPQFRLCLMHSY